MAEGELGFHHASVRRARSLHQKKHRQKERCFLVEGAQLIGEALAARAQVEQVFALRGAVAAELAGSLQSASVPVSVVDQRTMDALTQVRSPAGVIAIVRCADRKVGDLAALVPAEGEARVLVLPALSDPGNAGTLIRTAEAFGVAAVYFGPRSVDPYNDKVVRSSMGAIFRVPLIVFEKWEALVKTVRGAGLSLVGTAPRSADVRSVTLPQRAAVIVGQERRGLAEIPSSDVDLVISIPHLPAVESLNASVAGAIVLYELWRAAQGERQGRH